MNVSVFVAASIASAALVACSGGSAQTPVAPKTPQNRCAFVADHLLSLLTPTARDAPVEELDRVRVELDTRCREDGWSAAAQECFLALRVKEDVDRCAAHLTDAQRASLNQPAQSAPATETE